MNTLAIDLPIEAIRQYCQKWHIQEFALFGSILRDDFHEDSDIDVLVTFAQDFRYTLFDLVHMTNELEGILGRRVDFIDRRAVEQSANYLRRREVLNTARVIYAA